MHPGFVGWFVDGVRWQQLNIFEELRCTGGFPRKYFRMFARKFATIAMAFFKLLSKYRSQGKLMYCTCASWSSFVDQVVTQVMFDMGQSQNMHLKHALADMDLTI